MASEPRTPWGRLLVTVWLSFLVFVLTLAWFELWPFDNM
jgi:hypothetical protein